jgi:hypothetical protein
MRVSLEINPALIAFALATLTGLRVAKIMRVKNKK